MSDFKVTDPPWEMNDLTPRDFDVLNELVGVCDYKGGKNTHRRGEGATPLDVGGRNGSHHSNTLRKLVRLGYAEHKKLGRAWGDAPTNYRGSKVYRPTDKGRQAVKERRT